MDAIVGMEGAGPGPSGKPRKIGAILAGIDAIAMDFIAVNLVGLDFKETLSVVQGKRRNLDGFLS